MGGMTGVAQMGWVIIDAGGTIRVQRADIQFGSHATQMLEVLRLIALDPASGSASGAERGTSGAKAATIGGRSL